MTAIHESDLPPVGQMVREHGLWAIKKWGQHFLLDQNITDRITKEALGIQDCHVIEIGPGPGTLSRSILSHQPRSLTLIELDRRFEPLLEPLAQAYGSRLDVVWQDALTIDCHKLVDRPRKIVANLPYNIATPLILRWLKHIRDFECVVVLIQREVADRFVAAPNGSAYGRLSVMAQWVASVERCFHVPPSVFTPPPKVESTVLRFTPRDCYDHQAGDDQRFDRRVTWDMMEKMVALSFQHRRKMLKSALRSLAKNPEELLQSLGIPITARAENLSVTDFLNLALKCFKNPDPIYPC